MTSSRLCLTILTSHTFTILSLQTLLLRVMLPQVATLGTQNVRVLVSHGARYGRAQLLDRPQDEMTSTVDIRQRSKSEWKDGQPTLTAVRHPAEKRY
jgi:hypothetical protein